MIEVKALRKSFDDREVLKGIDITFEPGECTLIIGKSGAGKTVLMKCLVGLEVPTSGEILYHGKDLIGLNGKSLRHLRTEMGMLFQNSALFDNMTLFENAMFPLEMFSNLKGDERKARVKDCLTKVQLWDARYKYPSEISGGMKKRGAIARAIVLGPKYLFCDEPTSGLDPETSKVIDILLKEITEESGIITVVNTHDMNSVNNIGDKVVFIHNGEKNWEGKGKEIENTDNTLLKNFVFISRL